jgi:hypothetical protein
MMHYVEDSISALEQALSRRDDNRAWSKELRNKSSSLVNSRLAKDISHEDYLMDRKRAQEDMTECRHRATLLNAEITKHRNAGVCVEASI